MKKPSLNGVTENIIDIGIPPCPQCDSNGILVRDLTVKSLLKSEAKEQIRDTAYYLCSNSECDISYYGTGKNNRFKTEDVNVPIWFKDDANPIIACYCNKISKDEVISTVKETGLDEMNAIIKHLRGKIKCVCSVKNPTGTCCDDFFNELISLALKND